MVKKKNMSFPTIIIISILATYALGGLLAAPWIPTSKKDLRRYFDVARLKPGETIIDLGSGDGRVLMEAARQGTTAIGYEVSLLPIIISSIRRCFSKPYRIHMKSFWKEDLSNADVIFAFLSPWANKKLYEKLQKEHKKPQRLITYTFKVDGVEPKEINKKKDRSTIYAYSIP